MCNYCNIWHDQLNITDLFFPPYIQYLNFVSCHSYISPHLQSHFSEFIQTLRHSTYLPNFNLHKSFEKSTTVNQIQPLILDKGTTKYVACMVNPVKGSKITLCQDYGSLNRVRAPSEPLNSMIFPWLFHDKEIPWPFSTQPCTQKGSARISFFCGIFQFFMTFPWLYTFFKDFHDFSRPGSQSFTFHDFSRFSMTAWSLFKVSFFVLFCTFLQVFPHTQTFMNNIVQRENMAK